MKTNGPYPPDMSSCGLLYPLTGVGPELIFGLNVIPKSAFHVSKGEITAGRRSNGRQYPSLARSSNAWVGIGLRQLPVRLLLQLLADRLPCAASARVASWSSPAAARSRWAFSRSQNASIGHWQASATDNCAPLGHRDASVRLSIDRSIPKAMDGGAHSEVTTPTRWKPDVWGARWRGRAPTARTGLSTCSDGSDRSHLRRAPAPSRVGSTLHLVLTTWRLS